MEKLNRDTDQLKKSVEELQNELSLKEETMRDMSTNHKEILEKQRIEIISLKERLEEVKTEKDNKDKEF